MKHEVINLQSKLKLFPEFWTPKVIAQINNYHIKLVKIKGDFVWHKHDDTDEMFFVISGKMVIHFRDGKVELKQGELFVVPKGKEHKPFAQDECEIMLFEPVGVVNTGDVKSDLTAETDIWI